MLDRPITIIAEIGINHNGDMGLAEEMIKSAKLCGADVAKFQIYLPGRDGLTEVSRRTSVIKANWDAIKATELSFGDVCYLKNRCDDNNIEFLASVFHPDRVMWTEKIGMKWYKIASCSVYNRALAQAIAVTGKPIILSWGYYEPQKGYPVLIDHPAAWARTKHLYCVSKYPTALNDLDLNENTFKGRYTGYSGHTISITAPIVAMVLGATIIEKHFTLDKTQPGPDQAGSMEPAELCQLCDIRDEIEVILR